MIQKGEYMEIIIKSNKIEERSITSCLEYNCGIFSRCSQDDDCPGYYICNEHCRSDDCLIGA